MSMDGITAGILLQAATNGSSHDEVYNLFKNLQGNKDAPTPEVVELVTSWIGRKCKIKYTSHTAIITGPNTSDRGFYPGGRFPVYVKIIDSDMPQAIGCKFEYGLDQIELIFSGEKPVIEVTRKRQAIHREDFLVRGIGKRAMHAVLLADANTSTPASEFLSEFELYWLIVVAAKFVQRKNNWKTFVIKLPYLSDKPHTSAKVYIRNSSGVEYCLGALGTFVESEHFTNDSHLCPKYFYIPEYKGSNEPWQKKKSL